MCSGVRVHLQQRFLETVFIVAVCRDEFRCVRSRINRHIFLNCMG